MGHTEAQGRRAGGEEARERPRVEQEDRDGYSPSLGRAACARTASCARKSRVIMRTPRALWRYIIHHTRRRVSDFSEGETL